MQGARQGYKTRKLRWGAVDLILYKHTYSNDCSVVEMSQFSKSGCPIFQDLPVVKTLSNQITDISRLARHNFRHFSQPPKLGRSTPYHWQPIKASHCGSCEPLAVTYQYNIPHLMSFCVHLMFLNKMFQYETMCGYKRVSDSSCFKDCYKWFVRLFYCDLKHS